MTHYKPYTNYKDSGIDWLGELPVDWVQTKINNFTHVVSNKGYPREELLSVYRDYGVILKNSRSDNHNKAGEDLSSYKLVEPGYLVLNKMKTWQGSLGISEYRGIVSPAYITCKITKEFENKYLHYLLRSQRYVFQYNKLSYGVRTDQWDMRYEDFKNTPIFIPPLDEQTAIANFLDQKTSQIKQFIALKEKTIELLKERKTAIINQAVTKGLNPNVKMKDSGIEWLGEIPAHWEVKKLKFLMSIRGRVGWKALTASEYVQDGFVFLATPNIKHKEIDYEDVNYITYQRFIESPELIIELGDVLLTKDGSTTGTVNVVRNLPRPSTVNSSIAVLRDFSGQLESEYIHFLIKSSYLTELIQFKKIGMGVPHLFQADIKQFQIILPPVEEQIEIVNYVKEEVNEVDELISQAEKEIELIKEYRESLISEAVTGKIDVKSL